MDRSGFAANVKQPSSGELMRAIDRLGVVGNVLYVAAHPDDENTRLLAWLANDKLVRAGYLSLTRGEGGQNLIGAEQSPLLGLIRTEELLAARAHRPRRAVVLAGARLRLLQDARRDAEDLGPRRHPRRRGRRCMKKFHPDVVITRFPPEGAETHGHHTASAMLAVEALKALEPGARPQARGVEPLQLRRAAAGGDELARLVEARRRRLQRAARHVVRRDGGAKAAACTRARASAWRRRAASQTRVLPRARRRAGGALDLRRHRPDLGPRARRQEGRRARGAHPRGVRRRRRRRAASPSWWRCAARCRRSPIIRGRRRSWPSSTRSSPAARGCSPRPPSPMRSPIRAARSALTVSAVNRSPAPMTLREVRLPGGDKIAVDKPLGDNKPVKVEHSFKLPAETRDYAAVLAGARRRRRGTGRCTTRRSSGARRRRRSPPSSSSPSAARR